MTVVFRGGDHPGWLVNVDAEGTGAALGCWERRCLTLASTERRELLLAVEVWVAEFLAGKADRKFYRWSISAAVRFCTVLRCAVELLKSGRVCLLRHVYYNHPKIFATQAASSAAVSKVSQALRIPRFKLGFLASPRGFFLGPISFSIGANGSTVCEMHQRQTLADRLPIFEDHVFASNFQMQGHGARAIIVIEKECAFASLIEEGLLQELPALLITGCGVPSLAARRMVRVAADQLRLPVFILTDSNPGGLRIALTYTVQSAAKSNLIGHIDPTLILVPEARWLGITDEGVARERAWCATHGEPVQEKPLTAAQRRNAERMVGRAREARKEDLWSREMMRLLLRGTSFDMEGMKSISLKQFLMRAITRETARGRRD